MAEEKNKPPKLDKKGKVTYMKVTGANATVVYKKNKDGSKTITWSKKK